VQGHYLNEKERNNISSLSALLCFRRHHLAA
jgi:hypothetical protein